jgi:hypothetical protein
MEKWCPFVGGGENKLSKMQPKISRKLFAVKFRIFGITEMVRKLNGALQYCAKHKNEGAT